VKRKKKVKALPKQYSAPKGSTREKLIKKASKLYKQGKIKQAAALREKMEEKERGKSKKKTRKKVVKRKGKKRNVNPKKKGGKK
jgi:hypothetical protein